MKKLNILFICNKSPWPPKEGGPIAMNQLIEGLADAGHHVKVLAVNSNKYAVSEKEIPPEYRKKTGLETGYINLKVKPLPAFLNLFTRKSYHVQRFISRDFEKLLIKTLKAEPFDIVQIETLFMSPYLKTVRKYSKAKIVLRAHNIEHLIWKRLWKTEKNPLKKAYLKHLYSTLEQYEKSVIRHYDAIVPITGKDALFFREKTGVPVKAISFGIDLERLKPYLKPAKEHALFHIGSMNWIPNQEGIRWFLQEVWPLVLNENPDIRLYLAGREMPHWLEEMKAKNVIVKGEVDDAYEFIARYSVSIAPLLSGSGIRIKIIESMALAKAVVSTAIGAEGIDYENGKNILIADTPEAFAAAIRKLWRDRSYCREVGEKASELIARNHNAKKIIADLTAVYHEIL